MGKSYKSILKNNALLHFIRSNNISDSSNIKYKTIQKTTEIIHHYGWNSIHFYSIGVYKLNNGIQISFDYCYEMDPSNIIKVQKIIYSKLLIIT